MELISSKLIRVRHDDMVDAILSFVFKTRPDLRPTGFNASEPMPKVSFSVDPGTGFTATITLESKIEDGTKI